MMTFLTRLCGLRHPNNIQAKTRRSTSGTRRGGPVPRANHWGRLHLEHLETRIVPANVVTNLNTSNTYTTIQAAVNAASPGDTLLASAGTYQENVTVPPGLNGLTIEGNNHGTNPNTGSRGAESIVEPPMTSNQDASSIFLVQSSNVTIDGFTIQGSNSGLTGGYMLPTGTLVYAAAGVSNDSNAGANSGTTDISGLTVQNNIIQDFKYYGIFGDTDLSAVSTNNTFTANHIEDISANDFATPVVGVGILVQNNFYAAVTSNVLDNTITIGVQTNTFNAANTGAAASISSNNITAGATDIWYNLMFATSSSFAVNSNTLNAISVAADAPWQGILVESVQNAVSVTFMGNIIDGTNAFDAGGSEPSAGIYVWNTTTSGTVLFSGGSVTGADYGALVTNSSVGGSQAGPGTTSATINGVSITANTIGVFVQDGFGSNTSPVSATILNSTKVVTNTSTGDGIEVSGAFATATIGTAGNGNAIYDNLYGIEFTYGGGGSVTANNFAGPMASQNNGTDLFLTSTAGAVTAGDANKFASSPITILNQSSGGIDFSSDSNTTFGGVALGSATVPQLYTIEDSIVDAIDVGTYGLVRLKSGNIYVTPNSFYSAGGTTTATINRAIAAASASDIINVEGGTYADTSTVLVNKAVTIAPGGVGIVAIVTLTGGITFSAAGSKLNVDVNSPYGTAGTDYDQIVSAGTVNLSQATLTFSQTVPGTTVPAQPLTIIQNNSGTNTITGSVSPIDGSTFTLGSASFYIFYNGGTNSMSVILVSGGTPQPIAYVSGTWTGLPPGTEITDAEFGTPPGVTAVIGVNAFATIAAAFAAISSSGEVVVNAGTYPEAVSVTGTQILEINNEKAVTINSLTTAAGTTVEINPSATYMTPLATLTTGDGTNTTAAGIITGLGSLIKQGTGTFTLSGNNTYSGGTTINGGTLKAGSSTALGASSGSLSDHATFNLNGFSITVGALSGDGIVTNNGSGTSTLTTTATGTFSGTIQNGSATTALTVSSGTLTLSGTNSYTGATTINTILDLTGSLIGSGASVTLNANGAQLNGSTTATPTGQITARGIVVSSGVTGTTIQLLKTLTNSTSGTGILLNPGSSASILNNGTSAANGITGDRIGIDVFGATALIQGNYISNNTGSGNDGISYAAGLRARNNGTTGAIVDAGQAGTGANFTGLGASTGGNVFNGYTQRGTIATSLPTIPQAILDLNSNSPNNKPGPQGAPYDLFAQNDTFNGVTPSSPPYTTIEELVYGDLESPTLGFINYVTNTSAPMLVATNYYNVNQALEHIQAPNQRSMIQHIQLVYSNYVYFGANGLTLTRVASAADGKTGDFFIGTIGMVLTSTTFDPVTGQFAFNFGFSGTGGRESSGSLEDGEYNLAIDGTKITSLPGGGGNTTTSTMNHFWRLFGDANGTGTITTSGANNDLSQFLAAYNSRTGMSNYRSYFDILNKGSINNTDYNAFQQRYGITLM